MRHLGEGQVLVLEIMIGVTLGIILAKILQENYDLIAFLVAKIIPSAISISKIIFCISALIYAADELTWIDYFKKEYEKLSSMDSYLIFFLALAMCIGIFGVIGNYIKWMCGDEIKQIDIDLRSFYLGSVLIAIFLIAKLIAEWVFPKDTAILVIMGLIIVATIIRALINNNKNT